MNGLFEIVKPYKGEKQGLAIFSIIANELYFLPHFLNHYRNLGVKEFYFLVDRSEDGSIEYLMEQDDCSVLKSQYKFKDRLKVKIGDKLLERRFADISRFLVPRQFFVGRWGLVVDADEFLIIPPQYKTISEFTDRLEENGLDCCRAMMVDFFPENLADISDKNYQDNPFSVAPFYDVVPCEWPDLSVHPSRLRHEYSVRTRLIQKLLEARPELRDSLKDSAPVMLHKIPLIKWSSNTVITDAHTANHRPSSNAQVMLAHFKFYPGWYTKVSDAIKNKQYSRGSIKYNSLYFAGIYAMKSDLVGERSVGPVSEIHEFSDQIVYDHLKKI